VEFVGRTARRPPGPAAQPRGRRAAWQGMCTALNRDAGCQQTSAALRAMRTVTRCSRSQQADQHCSACGAPTPALLSRIAPLTVWPTPACREQVVMFGGCGAEGQLLADFWALDVGKAQWTDLRQQAAGLANRSANPHCFGADRRRHGRYALAVAKSGAEEAEGRPQSRECCAPGCC